MRKLLLAALGAGDNAIRQQLRSYPLVPGDYWDVTSVKIDDGHFADSADFLADQFRKQNDFMKSKGWIKAYYILSNNNSREDEPDLYLITVSDHVPTAAEQTERHEAINAYMATTRQSMTESGHRATYRHIAGDMLLEQMNWSH